MTTPTAVGGGRGVPGGASDTTIDRRATGPVLEGGLSGGGGTKSGDLAGGSTTADSEGAGGNAAD